jgi:hypothetical protein
MSFRSVTVKAALLGAMEPTGLCVGCLAKRAGLPLVVVVAELSSIDIARADCGRPPLGPLEAWCERCESRRPIYRLRAATA